MFSLGNLESNLEPHVSGRHVTEIEMNSAGASISMLSEIALWGIDERSDWLSEMREP